MNYPNKTVTEDAAMTNPGAQAMLEPCPFCGGSATMEQTDSNRWSVGCDYGDEPTCMGYQSLTTFSRRSEAIEAWNKRASAVQGEPVAWEALALAVNIIMASEPGDSRAVSDEAVALAAVSCGDTSEPVMKVIRKALAHPAIGTPVEVVAEALQNFWQGPSGRSWAECQEKLPPQADWFRKLADVAIAAIGTPDDPLPRCKHGNCLVDGAGEHLEPPCGCRIGTPNNAREGK